MFTFRKLCAKDIPMMISIIRDIGFKEFKNCFDSESVKRIIASSSKTGKELTIDVGFDIFMSATSVIIDNIDKCEKTIIKLLASASGQSVEEVENLGLADFATLVKEFFGLPDFTDFFEVAFKSVNTER